MRIISLVMTLIIIISELSVSTIKTEAASIEYNYAKLLQESLYFYDANMCGTEVSDKFAFSWRGNCHAGDKKVPHQRSPSAAS